MVRGEEDGKETQYWLVPSAPQRAGPASAKRTVLKGPAGFSFTKKRFATKVEALPTDGSGAATGGAKRAEKGGDKDQAGKRQAIERRAVPEGTTLVQTKTEGGCLAHSLVAGIQWVKQSSKPTASARHAYALKSLYEPFGTVVTLVTQSLAFLRRLLGQTGKGRLLELQAAAEVFGVTIAVVPHDLAAVPVKFGLGPFKIALYYTGDHYDFFKATSGIQYPDAVLLIETKDKPEGGRGWGDNDDAAGNLSGLTIWTRNFAGDHVKRGKVSREIPQQAEAASSSSGGQQNIREAFAVLAKDRRRTARRQCRG